MKLSKAQIAALEALMHDDRTHIVLPGLDGKIYITNHRGFKYALARGTFDVLFRLKLIHDVNKGNRVQPDWRISPLGKDALKQVQAQQ